MCTRFPETVGRWIIHGGETPADSIGGINLSDWDQRKRSAAQIRLRPILMTTAAMAALYPRFSLGGFVGFFALRGAEAQTQGAQALYEPALLLAQEDVENAVTRLVQDQSRTASLIQSASHAASAIDIAGKRYKAGAGSYLALLENQRALFQIRQEVADAETASYVNVIALYKALGWGSN